jgi:hypothetical protein
VLSTVTLIKFSSRRPNADRNVLSPTSRIIWNQVLVLLAVLTLPCAAHADIAPGPMRESPSVELTVDGLGPNHVLFTRESLSTVLTDGGRPLRLFWAARLPNLYLMEKKAFEAWLKTHPPAPGWRPQIDELIASAAVVTCSVRSADDQAPRAPGNDPEYATGHPVRVHYALTEVSAARCVMREVGTTDAGAAEPPAAEEARGVARGRAGCAMFSGGSEPGGLVLALLGSFCVWARRRSASRVVGARRGAP